MKIKLLNMGEVSALAGLLNDQAVIVKIIIYAGGNCRAWWELFFLFTSKHIHFNIFLFSPKALSYFIRMALPKILLWNEMS